MSKEPSRIYMVRHGECRANVEDINLSPEADIITEKGILQSSLLGKKLQNVVFTKVYSSDYPRAVDTIKEILRHLKTPIPEIIQDARIREREMGNSENRPMKEVWFALFKAAREQGTQMLEFEVPGGETVQHMESRIESFLEEILQIIRSSEQPQTILVVSHGLIMLRMMLKLRFWSKDTTKNFLLTNFSSQKLLAHVKNTGYHLLTVSTDESDTAKTVVDIAKLHESSHLDPLKPKVPVKPSKDYQEVLENFMELAQQQCTTI